MSYGSPASLDPHLELSSIQTDDNPDKIRSAAFSPTMIDAALVFDDGIVGMMDESTTRSEAMP